MGEAPWKAPSSSEVTLEPESSDTKQTQGQEQEEEYEYTLSEEEDLEAARVEAEKQKNIFQQPATGPPPALKKSLDKGQQPQFQGYIQRSGDGNQTSTKDKSQKQSQSNIHLNTHTLKVGLKEVRRLVGPIHLQMMMQVMILIQMDQMLK